MTTHFTKREADFITHLLSQVTVKAAAPDAQEIVSLVASIAAKLIKLTEAEAEVKKEEPCLDANQSKKK